MPIVGFDILNEFKKHYGSSTKQMGQYFCIPSSISNALRILGDTIYSQDIIRDIYYKKHSRILESDINEQMKGVSFDVIKALSTEKAFKENYSYEIFERPGDNNPFDLTKATEALKFINDKLKINKPVIISTWGFDYNGKTLQLSCCHMWLALAFDSDRNIYIIHDQGIDQIIEVPTDYYKDININGNTMLLNLGLRGRITHTDYNCLTISRKMVKAPN